MLLNTHTHSLSLVTVRRDANLFPLLDRKKKKISFLQWFKAGNVCRLTTVRHNCLSNGQLSVQQFFGFVPHSNAAPLCNRICVSMEYASHPLFGPAIERFLIKSERDRTLTSHRTNCKQALSVEKGHPLTVRKFFEYFHRRVWADGPNSTCHVGSPANTPTYANGVRCL